jgi:hypothetical protein
MSNLSQVSHCSRYTLRPMAHRNKDLTDSRSLLAGFDGCEERRKKRMDYSNSRFETRSVMNYKPIV